MTSNQEIMLPPSGPRWDRADVLERVTRRMINGESLRSICTNMRRTPDGSYVLVDAPDLVPDRSTILRWMNDDENFAATMARARDLQADAHADDVVEIANKVEAGLLNPKAGAVAIAAKQWAARHMRPKKWNIATMENQGGDGSGDKAAALKALMEKLPG